MSSDRPNGEPEVQEHPDDRTTSGGDAEEARRRASELESALTDTNDRLLRALAEQENIRRRADRDREEAVRFAGSGLVRDLLATADNLRRAIESVRDDVADDTVRQLLEGVAATERALLGAFEKHGVRRLDPLGEPFDPNRHQAMFEAADEQRPAGTVVAVLQPGYLHHDRLLRPAMVGVARGDGDQATAEPGAGSEKR